MFSGIIGAEGTVASVTASGSGKSFLIDCPSGFLDGVSEGASIAVDGACQTVERFDGNAFGFFSSPETLQKTTLGEIRPGCVCNLERALTLATPLDGHIVTGHVDTVARILRIEDRRESWLVELSLPAEIRRLVAEKGSLAVNGVSLTVNVVRGDRVALMVIPFTFSHTNLRRLSPGDRVNLEADILARYAARFLETAGESGQGGMARLLEENGYT